MDFSNTEEVDKQVQMRLSAGNDSTASEIFQLSVFTRPDRPTALSGQSIGGKNQIRSYNNRSTNLKPSPLFSTISTTATSSDNGVYNNSRHQQHKPKVTGPRSSGPAIRKRTTAPISNVDPQQSDGRPKKKFHLTGLQSEIEARRQQLQQQREAAVDHEEIESIGSDSSSADFQATSAKRLQTLAKSTADGSKTRSMLLNASYRAGQDMFAVVDGAPTVHASKQSSSQRKCSSNSTTKFGSRVFGAEENEEGDRNSSSIVADKKISFRIKEFTIGPQSITRSTGDKWRVVFIDNRMLVFRSPDEIWFSFRPIRIEVEEADRHSVIIYVTSQLLQGPIEGLEEYTDGAEQHALTFFCESPAGCSSLPVTAKRINEAVPDIQVQLHDKLPYRISSSKPLKSEEPITVQALRRLTRRKSAPAAVPAEPIEIDLLADDDDESFNTATAINDDKHRLSMGARSSRRQVAKREMSFTYPFDGLLHSISLTASDQERLNEGEMLNDNLIEFYLRYLYDKKFSDAIKSRLFIFNTFFYKKLTTAIPGKTDCPHTRVMKWTKNVDLFGMDFILIPINEHLHWYSALVCYPSRALSTPQDATSPDPASVQSSPASGKGLSSQRSATKLPRQKSAETMTSTDNCFVLLFDSLGSRRRAHAIKHIKNYLASEAALKRPDMQFNADKLSGLYVKAPVQPNHTDCGVYLLHYMELFFNEDPDGVFLKCVMRSDEIKYWFTIKDIVEKRRYLWELMDRMKFEYCRQVTAQYDAASSLATAASPLKVQDQIEP